MSVHHVVQKGSPYFGDDLIANFVLVCGTGSSGCHGAYHGSPYVAYLKPVEGLARQERRDHYWVAQRIGDRVLAERPDTILYVVEKFGSPSAAFAFLERDYFIHPADATRVYERAKAAA